MSSIKPENLSAYLISTYKMLKGAFPDGIEPKYYHPLLSLLNEEMSYRNLAEVINVVTGIDQAKVLNDIYSIESVNRPTVEAVNRVRQLLLPYGYDKWLQED